MCTQPFAPYRIAPEDVGMVEVGSQDTHARRRIPHVLGRNAAGRAGNLLVSQLCGDDGSWSGYPPHKHDTERPPGYEGKIFTILVGRQQCLLLQSFEALHRHLTEKSRASR